ncbi:MAG: HAD family hydrolase [Tepidisphaeraceae bacterium]|jgi:putative hydrolase of the HAD superfamily
MVRAILFDLGDTLLDFAPMKTKTLVAQGARNSYDRLQQMGCPLPSFNRYLRGNFGAVRRALIWSRLRRRDFSTFEIMRQRNIRLGIPNTDDLMFDLGWQWYKGVVDYSSVDPNLIPTLAQLRDAGIKLGVVSNTVVGGPLIDRHMEIMGLLEFFPVRIYSCEVGYRKPSPRIFNAALAAIGEKPQDVLFVGDLVKKDIIGAGRMGMKTCLRQPNAQGTSHPIADYLVRQISELSAIVLPASRQARRPVVAPAEIDLVSADTEAMANQTN